MTPLAKIFQVPHLFLAQFVFPFRLLLRPSGQTLSRVLILVLVLGLLSSCEKDAEKEALLSTYEAFVSVIERKEFDQIPQFVASDYSDSFRQDRERAIGRLAMTFQSYESMDVRDSIEKVTIQGLTAEMEIKVKMYGVKKGESIPLFGAPLFSHKVLAGFKKTQGSWFLHSLVVENRRGRW